MPELYRCADIFLHTTIGESFGNVYVEALASGLPIVAHDEPVTRWILEDNAYLVDTRHENALVDALRSARFSATRENSEKGVAFAQSKYSWRAVAARYRDFFAKVRERSS
jgi:glycosyltransferase involved in cell wall biosynthesis